MTGPISNNRLLTQDPNPVDGQDSNVIFSPGINARYSISDFVWIDGEYREVIGFPTSDEMEVTGSIISVAGGPYTIYEEPTQNSISTMTDGVYRTITEYMATSPGTMNLYYDSSDGVSMVVSTTTYSSDARLKNVLTNVDSGLDIIKALNPIKYEWNDKYKELFGEDNQQRYGFIAQNVQEVLPEMVKKNNEGYLRLNLDGFEAITTSAIQEQQQQIEELQNENQMLKQALCDLHPDLEIC